MSLPLDSQIRTLLDPEELEHLSDTGRRRPGSTRGFLDEDGCWLPRRFERVVWVVIDALRYDFAARAPEVEAPDKKHPPGKPIAR